MSSLAAKAEASLTINSVEHLGWMEVTVTRSMEQLAHTFEIGFTERWADDKKVSPIREGDACVLKLGDKVVVSGYVDDLSIDYDANDVTMRVSGRSNTGDLVDCGAIYKKGQWKNQDLKTIAENLCSPFGISVKADVSVSDKFKTFAIHDSETVHETLERACRMRGIIMTSSRTGNLVFTKIGAKKTETVIEYGKNVLRGGYNGSWKDRFSNYYIKGQGPGSDDSFGKPVSQAKAAATDDTVVAANRHRPCVLHAEHHDTSAKLQRRADWERNVRIGRSQRLTYTLEGWENAEGLWEPNTLVRVVDSRLRIDRELLVITVRQSRGAEGTISELEIADPITMTTEPPKSKKKGDTKDMYGSKK